MLGHYVEYKGQCFIVLQLRDDMILIGSADGVRFQVKTTSVKATKYRPAEVRKYRDQDYIVTAKGLIFSSRTGKLMQWPENDGNRKAILAT